MANQPKTPHRTIRIDDDLWNEAKRVAAQRGDVLSEVIRVAIALYIRPPLPTAAGSRACAPCPTERTDGGTPEPRQSGS